MSSVRTLRAICIIMGLARFDARAQSTRADGGHAVVSQLDVFPKHFLLHPGEQVHYQVRIGHDKRSQSVSSYQFTVDNSEIVRPIQRPNGELFVEGVRPGRTELTLRTTESERRITIEVAGSPEPPIVGVPYSAIKEIKAKEFLIVGHANRDGFDQTGVAKAGIDRLVRQAKKNRVPVIYFVSNEFPDWYTADRRPDYAVVSEGQEHGIYVNAERVTFTGGSFMFCTLRNVQMTLHGMLKHAELRRIEFVFPAQAIWVEDIWGPGELRPYPAPMVLLKTLFQRRVDDAHAYDQVVVPFLDRTIKQFPVAGYPSNPPTPPLQDLLTDWNIEVRFGRRFERTYRRASSEKTVLIEFPGT